MRDAVGRKYIQEKWFEVIREVKDKETKQYRTSTLDKVKKILRKLNNFKAPRQDGKSINILKEYGKNQENCKKIKNPLMRTIYSYNSR